MKFTKKPVLTISVIGLAFFLISGYLLSDDLFFSRLIRKNKITDPEQAFAYVEKHIYNPGLSIVPGLSPRYLLTERKYLYCDEGAILLATIVQKLGYKTRLADIWIPPGISNHTVLEVYQDGKWKTYDTVQNLQGLDYHAIIDLYESNLWRTDKFAPQKRVCLNPAKHKLIKHKYRPYPGIYNWLIQRNFYLKELMLFLRNIPG